MESASPTSAVPHADNLDDAGRAVLPSASAVITTVPAAKRLGHDARGPRPWASTRLETPARPPLDITATPVATGPLSRPIVGDVTGFFSGATRKPAGGRLVEGRSARADLRTSGAH
jgi:hypothetical protein